MSTAVLPTYFISHGGGPWPWMKEQMGGVYDQLEASLARMPMVALGAAEGEAATRVHHEREFFGGITVSSYRFG